MITELVGCRDVSRWSNRIFEEVVIRSYQIYEADDDVMGLYVKNAVPYSVNMIMSIGVVTVATYLYVRIVMYRLYNHTIILLRSRCNVNNDII